MAEVGVEPAQPRSDSSSLILSQVGHADCLPAQWSRMESNHRFLGVDQASLPLDHGTDLRSKSEVEPGVDDSDRRYQRHVSASILLDSMTSKRNDR